MITNALLYQPAVVERFRQLNLNHRLGHAYLFTGPQCVGKTATALAVAKLLNCTAPAHRSAPFCGECPSCRKIESGQHPDVLVVDRGEGESIKIHQIRELIGRTQLRSFEANRKVFVIRNAEDLTPESANALLKTLEEPTKDTLLILTTAVPGKSLDTIQSRCQRVYFYPLSQSRLAGELQQEYNALPHEAHFVAYFADGCRGKAQALLTQGIIKKKNEVIDNMILRHNDAYLQNVLKDKDKATVQTVLLILLSWFRDVVLVKSGVPAQRIMHIDRQADLDRIAGRTTFEDLYATVDEIINTLNLLKDNFNTKIAMAVIRERVCVV